MIITDLPLELKRYILSFCPNTQPYFSTCKKIRESDPYVNFFAWLPLANEIFAGLCGVAKLNPNIYSTAEKSALHKDAYEETVHKIASLPSGSLPIIHALPF